MEDYVYVNELLMKHAKHTPNVALLDYIERNDEYIVLYRDDGDVCTPYIIHHLTDSGLYYGRYYGKGWVAWLDFAEMKRYYTGDLT